MKYTIELTNEQRTILDDLLKHVGVDVTLKQDISLPIKESPAYKKGYEDGKLQKVPPKERLDKVRQEGYEEALKDLKEIWNCDKMDKFMNNTYGCVMPIPYMFEQYNLQSVIKRFKEWKAEQDKIKVGDVVRFAASPRKMIVTSVDSDSICTVDNNGKVDTWKASAELCRWGAYNVADRLKDLFKDI